MFAERDSDTVWAVAMLVAASGSSPLITLTAGEKTEISRILGRTIS